MSLQFLLVCFHCVYINNYRPVYCEPEEGVDCNNDDPQDGDVLDSSDEDDKICIFSEVMSVAILRCFFLLGRL